MHKYKRHLLLVLQLMVLAATFAATVVALMYPACIEHMLAEVARGVAAGLLLALVKVLVEVSQPDMVCQSLLSWCCSGFAVAHHELKGGLLGGYLLGLVLAMWACWNG